MTGQYDPFEMPPEANTPRVSLYPGDSRASFPLPRRCQHRCSRVNSEYLSTRSKSSGKPPRAAAQIEHSPLAERQFLAIAVIIRPAILDVVEQHKVGVSEKSGLHFENRNSCNLNGRALHSDCRHVPGETFPAQMPRERVTQRTLVVLWSPALSVSRRPVIWCQFPRISTHAVLPGPLLTEQYPHTGHAMTDHRTQKNTAVVPGWPFSGRPGAHEHRASS